jgi:hypothetical protein
MTSEEYKQDQQRRREAQAPAVRGSGYSTRPPNRAGSGPAVLVVLSIVAAVIVAKYAWNKAEPPAPANTRPQSQIASKARPVKPTPPIPADDTPDSQYRRPSPYTDPSLARQTEPPANPDQPTPAGVPPAGQAIEFQGVDRKGVNKGCDRQGELILDNTSLRFNCPSKPKRTIIIDRRAVRAEDDGVVDATSGDKYHFKIEGMNKDRVRAVFRDWAPRPAFEPATP